MMQEHGWRSSKNWGKYPGPRWAAYKLSTQTVGCYLEEVFVVRLCGYAMMWERLKKP